MANRIYQKKAKVLYNSHIVSRYYKLAFNLSEIARSARPGQFVMLRLSSNYQTLLRRPFSIHGLVHSQRKSSKPNDIEILYEVVGKGTEILSEKKPGDYLDILGPLGNGFSLLPARYSLLVGGGMGVAPLLFLAQRLIERTTQYARRNTLVLIGAKTKKEVLSQKEFASLGLSVKISTDDGSFGFKGRVTELLKNILRTTHDARRRAIYACGPKPMLDKISIISKQYEIPTQISLDEYMACGLGVCLGCMVETKEGQKLVCHDGPVFDASMIRWYNK